MNGAHVKLLAVLAIFAVPAAAQLPTWAENVCAEENALACHAMHRLYNPARFYLWPNNANESRRFVDLRPQWMVDENWQVCQRQSQWNIPGDRDNASDVLEAFMHGPHVYEEHNRLLLSIFRGGESASGHFAFYIEGPHHSRSGRVDWPEAWTIYVGLFRTADGNPFNQYRPAWFARGDIRLNVRRLLNWLRHEEVRLSLFNNIRGRGDALGVAGFAEGHGLPAVPEMRNAGTNRLRLWRGIGFNRSRSIFFNGWWTGGTVRGEWATMTCDNAEF